MEGVCCGLNVNTQFLEGIGRASWRRWYSRSAGRSRLLDLKKSVDASRRRGVVRIALSSPEWGGPKRENRREGDGTRECYRWLGKDDLMTKTGYGYAKCLTVAGTATTMIHISQCHVGEVLRGKTAQREMEQVNAIGGWLR